MAKIMTPPTEGVELAPIGLLKHVSLLHKGLPEHASRPTDHDTAMKYAMEDLDNFPALKVVATDEGLGVIDGNHRWNAYIIRAKLQALGLYDSDRKTQEEALKHKLSPEAQAVYDKSLETLQVKVQAKAYTSWEEVAKACLTANLENGLPPANKARSLMALEYWLIVRNEENPPSQASVARKFGIQPPTLNEYVKAHDRKLEAEAVVAEGEVLEGEEEEAKEKTQVDYKAKALKSLENLTKALNTLETKGSSDDYLEVMAMVFSLGFKGEWLKQDNMTVDETATHLQKVMEISSLDGSNLGHVEHFFMGLQKMLMKNEAAKKKTPKKTPVTIKKPTAKATEEGPKK